MLNYFTSTNFFMKMLKCAKTQILPVQIRPCLDHHKVNRSQLQQHRVIYLREANPFPTTIEWQIARGSCEERRGTTTRDAERVSYGQLNGGWVRSYLKTPTGNPRLSCRLTAAKWCGWREYRKERFRNDLVAVRLDLLRKFGNEEHDHGTFVKWW